MKCLCRLMVCVAAFVLAGTTFAGGNVKSGPQVGETLPGAFEPLNVTGPHAGENHCLYCENGQNPVAMVFARSLTPELAQLIKQIDTANAKHKAVKMGSFVVFLSQDPKLPQQLKDLAAKEKLQHTVLSIDGPVGPEDYKVAKQADITVVLYVEDTVKANHTFAKGQLNEKGIGQVMASLPKILPKK